MNIEVHTDLIQDFLDGNIVFKITSKEGREIGMVNTKEDYERKLWSHQYIPLLFTVSFYRQLSYLYGCLNLKYQHPRKETFIFWWRRLRTKEWKTWFTVHPYEESLFESSSSVESSLST